MLEGEKSRGRAKTPSFSFGEGEVEEEHRGEEIGEGKEKEVSEMSCQYGEEAMERGDSFSAKERGCRGKGVATVTPTKVDGYSAREIQRVGFQSNRRVKATSTSLRNGVLG